MRHQITKQFEFEAAHSLTNYIGPCHSVHGHSYKLEVTVERLDKKLVVSNQQSEGMVMDLSALGETVKEIIVEKLDHKDLNYIAFRGRLIRTTAENLATEIYYMVQKKLADTGYQCRVAQIRLWETSKGYATLIAEEGDELYATD